MAPNPTAAPALARTKPKRDPHVERLLIKPTQKNQAPVNGGAGASENFLYFSLNARNQNNNDEGWCQHRDGQSNPTDCENGVGTNGKHLLFHNRPGFPTCE